MSSSRRPGPWAACLLAATTACASPLKLDQIYGPSAVATERAPAVRWLASGTAYSTLEPSKSIEGGTDVVRYEAATGKRSILVRSEELASAGDKKPPVIVDHTWSHDQRYLLLKVAAAGASRYNPVAAYSLFDLQHRRLRALGQRLPPASLLHAELSPDGIRIAYVSGNNLYVESVDDSRIAQLTDDGSETIVNGRGDLAYDEEFSLGKAFEWSPDSKRIAYWRFDTSPVQTFFLISNLEGQYSKPLPMRYPKPGTANSSVKVGVVAVDAPGTTWIALEGDSGDRYVPRMHWAGNSRELLVQQENRLQNTNRLLLADASTGKTRQIMVETDAAWLLPNDRVRWLDEGRSFAWLSERDGWMHLYVVSRDGAHIELRTPGNFDVISIEALDERAGQAYFIASPGRPAERYLYRASIRGTSKIERLTPSGNVGSHDYDVAPGGRWGIHTFSTARTPPVTDVVRLPAHTPARVLSDNSKLRAMLRDTPPVGFEFFQVDIGPTVLDAWMMKPANFDPSRKYPLLMYVYSEPAGQTVVDRWGGDRHLWHMLLTQRGYLVASVDSRGAASPRGRDWRRSIYRQVGILASADQAAAVRKMLVDRPYIDSKRVGVWGWSGGGAMTLNALFRYPELYSTGIAVASPADQLLYNSIYQERYMGLPRDNPQGYRDGSPIHFAQNLQGNLLIVHGTGDDNVHYQNAEQLVDRLVALNKPFTLMSYPDRRHGIAEGENTRLHLFDLATRFLEDHLPPNP